MATRRGPRFKESRRFGVNVCGHPKALRRMDKQTFGRKKASEYKLQLYEKQKAKAYYGILERQMRNAFKRAYRSRGETGIELLMLLESRLDNIVYRAGFARSIRMARQMVTHGHIEVNGNRVNIPSYQLKPGDQISLREGSRDVEHFRESFVDLAGHYPYIARDLEQYLVTYSRRPEREELPVDINEQYIVEFYSRYA